MTAHKLTDDYRLEQRVRRAVQAGLKEFSLIEPGDRVLVGLSGGKDSMALLELLGGLARRRDGAFRVEALHVRMGNVDYRTDVGYLAKFAADCGCGFYLREISFEADRNERRSPCFLCSWNRRKQLFEMAQELGCTKIALGHHRDDILRTALMNLTFAGSFATMPVKSECGNSLSLSSDRCVALMRRTCAVGPKFMVISRWSRPALTTEKATAGRSRASSTLCNGCALKLGTAFGMLWRRTENSSSYSFLSLSMNDLLSALRLSLFSLSSCWIVASPVK